MGNCAMKSKQKAHVSSPQQQRVTVNNLRINKGINCPKCNMFFEIGTPFLFVNSHIESCLLTDDSALNASNLVAHDGQIDPNAASRTQADHKYIWVKKSNEKGEATWEKTVLKNTMTADHLENMSLESAKALDFEDKKKWMKLQIDKVRIPWVMGADHLHISHKNVVETALKGVKKVNMHKEVKIVFDEETNVNDAGGLLREFVHLCCQEVFKAENNLFVRTQTEEVIYTINPKADNSQRNLELYGFIGKVIGKAIFEQVNIPVQLDHLILKQMVRKELALEDLLSVDKQLYNSLKYIRDTEINDSDIFEEYFVVKSPIDQQEIELIPNGRDIKITDENKEEYIKSILDWMGKKSIHLKLIAFLKGLFQVVPKDALKALNVQELEMVLNGLPFIDVKDWEQNSTYKGSYYKNHKIVKWFWEVVHDLPQDDLSKFFYFVTGSTRPPVDGFSALQSNRGEIQKFTVESTKYNHDSMSLKAHTCFNRLELPMYPKKELVEEAVQTVLKMNFEGVYGLD